MENLLHIIQGGFDMKPRRACTERSRSPALERSEGIDFHKSAGLSSL